MASPGLPVDLASTYPDTASDPSIRLHQAHHDRIHTLVNLFDTDLKPAAGAVVVGNGSLLASRALSARDIASVPEVVNVKDYGARGDSSVDDTAALKRAAATLRAGDCLFFPAGKYVITSPISITVPCLVQGAGGGVTTRSPQADLGVVLVNPTSSSGLFTVTADAVSFQRLFLTSGGGPQASAKNQTTAITFVRGDLGSVQQCVFTGWHRWLWFRNCASWVVRDNNFQLATGYGVQVQNVAAPDEGDSVLTGNTFASNAPWNTAALVRQESGGGLKVIGNKFLCPGTPGARVGFDLAVADGAQTSVLLMSANSFENFGTGSIRITQAGSQNTGTFNKINITGNQFTGGRSSGPVIEIAGRGAGINLADVLISSNLFDGDGVRPKSFVAVSRAARVVISGNTFFKAPLAVDIGAGATTTAVTPSNAFFEVDHHVSGTPFDAG